MGNSLSVCSNKFAHNCFVVVSATPRPQRAPNRTRTYRILSAVRVPVPYNGTSAVFFKERETSEAKDIQKLKCCLGWLRNRKLDLSDLSLRILSRPGGVFGWAAGLLSAYIVAACYGCVPHCPTVRHEQHMQHRLPLQPKSHTNLYQRQKETELSLSDNQYSQRRD